jgi:CNT family concentrative nucleoside transporter
MLIAVVAMLLAAVAFAALVTIPASVPGDRRFELTIGRVFGWIFSPFMWMLGIPWRDALPAGELMGTKTVLNELIAYLDMSRMASDAIEPRTRLMMIYALCGFANFASVAIMIGGLSSICPERRDDFADLGLKSLLAGTLTNMLSAALIGLAPLFAAALTIFSLSPCRRRSHIRHFEIGRCAPSFSFFTSAAGSASGTASCRTTWRTRLLPESAE